MGYSTNRSPCRSIATEGRESAFAVDGTPIMLTDSREAAIANAWSNELQTVSVHRAHASHE
ncbi:hypothetical protein XH99_28210 [Bradyrhizobium nanningense]|uniref:Uncharacterized protein n=1 Tax=Bradyrhizobium nanningense TaxID=1325118 RepID=A0A4Q0RY81_9BRAD|nr:hypothetical protein XH99_28210 [Bradyrhizobium nanningense]RXH30584.1 hypothetical protein XH84_18865 [Bradyrhizobium nanningense]TQF31698.1 hypothetical protein UNPA324_20250 [Bradyrhizobium sp. UNPA324]